jgi:glucan 1,3-beta-glucosidase
VCLDVHVSESQLTESLGTSGESLTVGQWSIGRRYTASDGTGSYQTGYLSVTPEKPMSLLDGAGRWVARSKPQYETKSAGDFVVATDFAGISNDGTGDQTDKINSLLSSSIGVGPVFFPAGIYAVSGTVKVPVGSIIVGEGWSQIMATGSFSQDESNPQVMVQ